jgi:hypothetical protein
LGLYIASSWRSGSGRLKPSRPLRILTAVQNDPEDTSALFKPSWVPHWDYCIDTPILGLYSSNHFASANKDVILTPPPPNIQNTLTVRGTLITRIIKHTDLLGSSSFDLSLPTTIIGPDSPLVQHLWETNPIAKTWLLNLKDADPESYPILPMMMTNDGRAIVSWDKMYVPSECTIVRTVG